MTVEQKINDLKTSNETLEQAKECALHGLRKRVVDLHHHFVQNKDYDIDNAKVAVTELMFWNDVVIGMELMAENVANKIAYDDKIYALTKTISMPRTKEQAWAEIATGLERKEDRAKYPNSIFVFKEGKCFFEHDEKNAIFWCSWSNVWSIFETEFGMNYSDIQDFIKGRVEEHFKCKGVTTPNCVLWFKEGVEEHFKRKGVITNFFITKSVTWWKSISSARV